MVCNCANSLRFTICNVDVIAEGFDSFDLCFFISKLAICQVINFLVPSSRNFVFAVSFPFDLNFFFLVYKLIVLFGVKF